MLFMVLSLLLKNNDVELNLYTLRLELTFELLIESCQRHVFFHCFLNTYKERVRGVTLRGLDLEVFQRLLQLNSMTLEVTHNNFGVKSKV